LVFESQGLHRTKELAINYCKLATDAISQLPYSESREALIQLCEKVIERKR
jgi:hexaprenyl-diphosphate synthase